MHLIEGVAFSIKLVFNFILAIYFKNPLQLERLEAKNQWFTYLTNDFEFLLCFILYHEKKNRKNAKTNYF